MNSAGMMFLLASEDSKFAQLSGTTLISITVLSVVSLIIYGIYRAVKLRIMQRTDALEKRRIKEFREKYCIEFDGEIMCINSRLVASQGCEENVEQIKHLHRIRLALHSFMGILDTKKEYNVLRTANSLYTHLEFLLQDAWKFDRDINFHRFWLRPGCSCPRMDNEDWYPHRHVTNGDCKIHGPGVLAAIEKKKVVKKKVVKKKVSKKTTKKKVTSGKRAKSKTNSKKDSKSSNRKRSTNSSSRKNS